MSMKSELYNNNKWPVLSELYYWIYNVITLVFVLRFQSAVFEEIELCKVIHWVWAILISTKQKTALKKTSEPVTNLIWKQFNALCQEEILEVLLI